MDFEHQFPDWDNEGIEPSEEIKKKGFEGGYKPPASLFNWFWSKVMKGVKELQTKLSGEEAAVHDTIKRMKGNSTAWDADIGHGLSRRANKSANVDAENLAYHMGKTSLNIKGGVEDDNDNQWMHGATSKPTPYKIAARNGAGAIESRVTQNLENLSIDAATGKVDTVLRANPLGKPKAVSGAEGDKIPDGMVSDAGGWGMNAANLATVLRHRHYQTLDHPDGCVTQAKLSAELRDRLIGNNTIASGEYAHAEGSGTIASGDYSHAEGSTTLAYSANSHTEGMQNAAGCAIFDVEVNVQTTPATVKLKNKAQTALLKQYIAASGSEFFYVYTSAIDIWVSDRTEYNVPLTWIEVEEFNETTGEITVKGTIEYTETICAYNKAIEPNQYNSAVHVEGSYNLANGESAHAEGIGSRAQGFGAHAEGVGTYANGAFNHAEGYMTFATDNATHAEGWQTKAAGPSCHAEGELTQAIGEADHAEGWETTAEGSACHAEGYQTLASGTYSHAEGYGAMTNGDAAHAEGYRTVANGEESHAEGNSTITGCGLFRVTVGSDKKATLQDKTQIDALKNYISKTNSKFFFTSWENSSSNDGSGNTRLTEIHVIGVDAATGKITTTENLVIAPGSINTIYAYHYSINTEATSGSSHVEGAYTAAIGRSSHAEGEYTLSSGHASHAEGHNTTAGGQYSHAEGFNTKADTYTCHAEGYVTHAEGIHSHAEGVQTTAKGQHSHAEGQNTKANGLVSHAEGSDTTASGDSSHAEGDSTTASGENSHAEGMGCIASEISSHAEGWYTEANGKYSHSEGMMTNTAEDSSHAEGEGTSAIAWTAHAENNGTVASGSCSHAEGEFTTAKGDTSHSEGYNTTAASYAEHVQGRYNKLSTTSATAYTSTANAMVIGNGTSTSARSNAFRVTFNGNVYGLATFHSTGADYAEYFEWADGNPDGEERIGKFVAIDGEKIHIATKNDTNILGIVSANPAVLGNAHEDTYHGMYLTDEWGRVQYEYVDVPAEYRERVTGKDEDGNNITEKIEIRPARKDYVPKLNPNYNPDEEYIPRSERNEWDAVGMMGQLLVRDDGTCTPGGFCTWTDGGAATASESGYYVMSRVSDDIVKVIFK